MIDKSVYGIGLLLLLWNISPVYADALVLGESTISYHGTLVEQGCHVSSNSANQNIHIGDFNVSDFRTVGKVSSAADLYITITDCVLAGNTQTYFSGTADESVPELLKLSGNALNGETAQGIAVEILDGDTDAQIPLHQPTTKYTKVKTTQDTTLHYKLRYKSTSSVVKGGDASAVLYFDILYQ